MATAAKTREDVPALKLRISELEKQVLDYKHRLDELRKAKSNYIVKKEKEYVQTGAVAQPQKMSKSGSIDSTSSLEPQFAAAATEPTVEENQACEECEQERARRLELEKIIQTLNSELDESKNLTAALKMENDEAKEEFERRTRRFQAELADAVYKEEESKNEVKKWEQSYKEWMEKMEARVNHLMQTNAFLQRMLEEQNPDRVDSMTSSTSKK